MQYARLLKIYGLELHMYIHCGGYPLFLLHGKHRPELPDWYLLFLCRYSSFCHESTWEWNSIFISKNTKFLFTFVCPYVRMYLVKIGNYPYFLSKMRKYYGDCPVFFTILNFSLILSDWNANVSIRFKIKRTAQFSPVRFNKMTAGIHAASI